MLPPTAFISGKVMLDNGSELTEPVAIQTICRGDRHTRAFSDRHGSFSFQFGDPSSGAGGDVSDASSTMMTRAQNQRDLRNWRDCQVQAVLAGFSSDVIELASRMNSMESTDVGRVVLHRLEHVEGTSISVTSALAPSGAKKALEKGRDEESKKKFDQAQQSLKKAVEIYPKYAAAWYELGHVQMQRNDVVSAKQSFQQAIAADPVYVNPYEGLAQLAFQAREWPAVLEVTHKLLALNSVNFPLAYFFEAVANYHLQDMDAAEKSARHGIRVDDAHQVSRLHYVLGMVLFHKRDYAHASESLRQYLQFTKEPTEVEAVNKQLSEIARLSAAPNTAAAEEKK